MSLRDRLMQSAAWKRSQGSGVVLPDSHLLLHFNQSLGMVDSSVHARPITNTGPATLETLHWKFGGSAALFNSNDHLIIPASNDWNFADGDFTIDVWLRPGSISGWRLIVCHDNESVLNGWRFSQNGQFMNFSMNSNIAMWYGVQDPNAVTYDTWYHFAVERYGPMLYMYRNGAIVASSNVGTVTINNPAQPLVVSQYWRYGQAWGQPFVGYMDEMRIIKGVAAYAGEPFTPPITQYAR